MHSGTPRKRAEALVRGLGWFSIGLGMTELLFAKRLGRAIGIRDHELLLRALGLREIGSGIGILAQPRPSLNALRARVAGDAIDLALLACALGAARTDKLRVSVATAAVVGVTALDALATQQLSRSASERAEGGVELRASIAINKPAEELFRFCHELENLPRLMSHVQSVRQQGGRTHWRAKLATGTEIAWDSEITHDQPNTRLAWKSVEGSPIDTQGSVEFSPLTTDRGTLVRLQIIYKPAGVLDSSLAHAFSALHEQMLREDLRRFKQLMEAGEIASTLGQSAGRRSLLSRHLP